MAAQPIWRKMMAKQGARPPTLKTIAEMTGLSLSTVSLSLRDGSNLKQATRDKVAKAAQQIGYVPNRAGVRLRTGRTNVLALVLAHSHVLDYTRQLIQGIGAYIHGTKFHLSVIPEFERSTDPEEAVRYILENRTADGVILTHTSARDPRVQLLTDAGFPFVTHGRTEFYTPHAYHDFHVEKYVQLAAERLRDKGRKNYLLLAEDNGTTNYANTVSGFRRALLALGLSGDIIDDPETLHVSMNARQLGVQLGRRAQPYDAIICNSEVIALAIISGLQESGLKLGQEYDLICKQTTEILPILYPHMDTVAEDLFATGSELTRLLVKRIEDGSDAISELQTLHEPIVHWRSDV
jgi:LacI family transcriptional regulator